jgi:hypothetical protein
MPLRQDESQPHGGISGRTSPDHTGGNVFREEIQLSQRQRRQGANTPGAIPTIDIGSADAPNSAIPPLLYTPHAAYNARVSAQNQSQRTGSRRQMRRDDWEDSTDEEEAGDLELQPAYTLSQASGQQALYDGTHAYQGGNPSARLPSARTPAIAGVSGPLAESAKGDVGASGPAAKKTPPLPTAHGQEHSSRPPAQLVETYGGTS